MDGGNLRARTALGVAACAIAACIMVPASADTEGAPGPAGAALLSGWRPAGSIEPPPDAAWCLGPAVAMHAGVLAVGPARDWDLGEDLGGVRLHRWTGRRWAEVAAVMHPSADAHANFGASLSLDEVTLAIGSPRDSAEGFESGAVFLWRRQGSGWASLGAVRRPQPSTSDMFGVSLALQGDTLVVGSPKADSGALDTGCVEVFRRVEGLWTHHATLVAPEGRVGALFGIAVAVDGDIIMVGAPGDDTQGPSAGRVHLFRRSPEGWRWDGSVGCPTGPRGWFGASVAAHRGLRIAGAPRATRPGSNFGFVRGAAWRIDHGPQGWRAVDVMVPADPSLGDAIGCSAATDGRTVVLGATADSLRGDLSGCGYVFRMGDTGWFSQRLDSERPDDSALIGHAVAVDAGWIALGRLGNPEETPGPGRVDLFRLSERTVDLAGPAARPRDHAERLDDPSSTTP